jgi:2-polyprenyl-3-methyl-5-hydroxy-6-metoxy-1,4-benzoquinol methylase
VIGARFANDGHPTLELTSEQLAAKRAVEDKLARGIYQVESVPCAICGGRELEPIAGKDRCGLRADVAICVACGLVQTNPRFTSESRDVYYNAEHRGLQHGDSGPADAFEYEQRRGLRISQFFADCGIGLDGKRVLEVGCGTGGILHVLRDGGATVVGFDVNEAYVRWGAKQHGLDLRVGSHASVGTVDVIVYAHVLEHLGDPKQELIASRALLGTGGVIYVEVPGIKRLDLYENDLLRYLQSAHLYHFSLRSLDNLAAVSGYRTEQGDETARALLVPAETRPWTSDRSEVLASLSEAERDRRVTWKHRVRRTLHRAGLLDRARRARRLLRRYLP